MPTVPHTFTPHTLAESAKVNANFEVFEQVLALTGGTLTGTLTLSSGNIVVSAGTITASGVITASGGFAGSGASLTSIPETAITDGSLLARVAATETISGLWTFTANGAGSPRFVGSDPGILLQETDVASGSRAWGILAGGGQLNISAYPDDWAGGPTMTVTLTRGGSLTVPGNLTVLSNATVVGTLGVASFSTTTTITAGTSIAATTSLSTGTSLSVGTTLNVGSTATINGNLVVANSLPQLILSEGDQASGSRDWTMYVASGVLRIAPAADGGSVSADAVQFTRSGTTPLAITVNVPLTLGSTLSTGGAVSVTGAISATSTITERSRSFAMGEQQAVSFNAGHWTTNSGSWTVDSGDVVCYSYCLVGDTMTLTVKVLNTTTPGTNTEFRVDIPDPFVSAQNVSVPALYGLTSSDDLVPNAIAEVASGVGYVRVYAYNNITFGATTNDTNIAFQISFKVS